MILVHITQVLPIIALLSSAHSCMCTCVCVCVCCYRGLDFLSSPKLWPFKDHFSDNLHSSFILSIWKGNSSGVCTPCQAMILIEKKFRQVKQLKKKRWRNKKKSIQKNPIGKPHNGTSGESWNPFSFPLAIISTFCIRDSTACFETTRPSGHTALL